MAVGQNILPKSDISAEGWIRLNNNEFKNVLFSADVINIHKSKIM